MAININGTGSITGLSSISAPGISGVPVGSASAPAFSFTGDTNTGIYSPGADQVAISTNSSERIRIGANGEVGIGGANYGTSGQVLTSGGSGAAPSWQTLSVSANSITQGNTSATVTDTGSDGRFVVTTEGSERLRVDSSGRLGIGTTSPGTTLEVAGAVRISGNANLPAQTNSNAVLAGGFASPESGRLFIGDGTGWRFLFSTRNASVTADKYLFGDRGTFEIRADSGEAPFIAKVNASEVARIDSSGRLLVGTSSALGPSTTSTGITLFPGDYSVMSSAGNEPLTLNRNNDGAILSCRRSGTNVGSISVTTTATAFNTSSDYRLKENVVDLDGAVDRLKQLPVCRFNFIADPDKTVDGFIAHEVQAVVPEAVTGAKDEVDADGNPIYQGIDQSKLVPLLTAALQETIGRIEALEAEVAALKAQ